MLWDEISYIRDEMSKAVFCDKMSSDEMPCIATKCHFISYHRHHSHHILNVYTVACWLVFRLLKIYIFS